MFVLNIDLDIGKKLIKVGLNIAYYRKFKNISQDELSSRANLRRTSISNIEAPNMFTNPTLSTIFSIAKALDIPASKLLEFKDEFS